MLHSEDHLNQTGTEENSLIKFENTRFSAGFYKKIFVILRPEILENERHKIQNHGFN
jgi:hypothetical protein